MHRFSQINKVFILSQPFNQRFFTIFTSKTVCLKYSNSDDVTVPVVCLNGQKLKREANVKHVGNIITSTLDDKNDIELKIWEYFCQVNKLLSDFRD